MNSKDCAYLLNKTGCFPRGRLKLLSAWEYTYIMLYKVVSGRRYY